MDSRRSITPTPCLAEKQAALDAILRAGIFNRSHNLQRLLVYVCEKHFAGRDDELKECTIATEALLRPTGFDPKRDSIVRVEIHRLRKRLAKYYEETGTSEPVRISIPEGQYVPQFTAPQALTALATIEHPVEVLPPTVAKRWRLAAALLLVTVMGAAAAAFALRPGAKKPVWAAPVVAPVVEPVAGPEREVRILAGRDRGFVDNQGQRWSADQYFSGGWAKVTHRPVQRAADPEIFTGMREGEFRYDIPLPPGRYELRLHFAETLFGDGNEAGGAESTRLFQINANGQQLASLVDILASAPGAGVADVLVFKDMQPAPDGRLHLEFRAAVNNEPFVNAIEVLPSEPGRIRPIRMVAQSRAVRDKFDRIWVPDYLALRGNVVKRTRPPENTDVPDLYRGERFGVFSYSIPVAQNGIYGLTMYMHEAWFGDPSNGSGGAGSRLFDVYVNHRPLLANFDLFQTTGGSRRAYVKTFHGLKPNARGKLVIDFEPSRNYACINAIELIDETPVPRP